MQLLESGREIVGDTLIEYAFFDYSQPVVICFNPAGMMLSKKDVSANAHAWSFELLSKLEINVLAINTIDDNHWFLATDFVNQIDRLTALVFPFSERLGYGASMGAFAVTQHAKTLGINRALLFSPLQPPNRKSDYDFRGELQTEWTIVFDPFNAEDKHIARLYPLNTQFLHYYGVGHQVIESLAKTHCLKPLFLQFYTGALDVIQFYKSQSKKRSVMRYYSYMDRNPTQKNTPRRKLVIKKHKLLFTLKNSNLLIGQVTHRIKKSIKKRTRKLGKSR